MLYAFLVLLNIIAVSTLVGWFMYSSTIFILLKTGNRKKKHVTKVMFVVLSYAYPFILAFFLYTCWQKYESNETLFAILASIMPPTIFGIGWIIAKILDRE